MTLFNAEEQHKFSGKKYLHAVYKEIGYMFVKPLNVVWQIITLAEPKMLRKFEKNMLFLNESTLDRYGRGTT